MDVNRYRNMNNSDLVDLAIKRGLVAGNYTRDEMIAFLQNYDEQVGTQINIQGNAGQLPTSPALRVPTVPPLRTVNPILETVHRKLRRAQYPVYDFEWKGFGGRLNGNNINGLSGNRFAEYITRYQTINFNGEIVSFIGYLMDRNDTQLIVEIFANLGFRRVNMSIDAYYNLLWYLNVASDPYDIGLTIDEKEYVSSLNVEQLVKLLGPNYRGPHDFASLLFATVSGKSSPRPDITTSPRYSQVAATEPPIVWNLAKNLYGIVDTENKIFSLYPPYVHVALQAPSVLEQIIGSVNEANVDQYIDAYQIVFPPRNPPNTNRGKIKYFIDEITKYDQVFARNDAVLAPPILTGKTKDQIRNILAVYTMKELVDAYEPMGIWRNRGELIDIIREEGRGGSTWSWRHRWCNNDDTRNLIEGEFHGDMNKDDPTNPTLSYGVQKNYRCYQMFELEESFREIDDIFHFAVPDYIDPKSGVKGIIDPTTGALLIKDFPIESIRQLRTLLRNAPIRYKVIPLLAKVDQGLEAANNAVILMRRLRTQYEAMDDASKYIIRLYLSWLFVFGMWLRYWNGPGNPWPTRWMDGGGQNELCEGARRDEHTFIQQSIRTAIIEAYEKDPELQQWIEALPLVDYNFRSGEPAIATGGVTTIKTILDNIQLGNFCIPHGSDLILRTSYFLINRILGFNTVPEFNNFINEMLVPLTDIERQVVDYQLQTIKDNKGNRVATLRSRQAKLALPLPKQPLFDPNTVDNTQHTDPNLGDQIRFGDRGGVN